MSLFLFSSRPCLLTAVYFKNKTEQKKTAHVSVNQTDLLCLLKSDHVEVKIPKK